MRGAKELDRKRVRLLAGATTRGGVRFEKGDEGVFRKVGVVDCTFTRGDGELMRVGGFLRSDFAIVVGDVCALDVTCPRCASKPKEACYSVGQDSYAGGGLLRSLRLLGCA